MVILLEYHFLLSNNVLLKTRSQFRPTWPELNANLNMIGQVCHEPAVGLTASCGRLIICSSRTSRNITCCNRWIFSYAASKYLRSHR